MFYFPTEMGFLLALVMIGWLVVAGVKAMGKGLSSTKDSDLQDIDVGMKQSPKGKAKLVRASYHKPSGRYGAIVRCRKTGNEVMPVGHSEQELKQEIEKAFKRFDEGEK